MRLLSVRRQRASPLATASSPVATLAATLTATVCYSLLATLGQTRDYCSTETFHAHCPAGTVILVTAARYGRMVLGKCIHVDFGFLGCSKDVIGVLDRNCSGRTECKLRVPDAALDATNPCIGDLTKYLEATYECVAVHSTESPSCHHGSARFSLPLPTGYVLGPSQSPTGLAGCTRVVSASLGQRVNVTLFDFGVLLPSSATAVPGPGSADDSDQTTAVDGGGDRMRVCHRLAMVTDVLARTVVDVCSSIEARVSHVYLSVGNAVEIRVLREATTTVERHFLLHYEVVGCPDVKLARSYWIRRTDAHLSVGCFSSGRSWQLTCRLRSWIGEIGNCSDADVKDAVTSANFPMKDDAAEAMMSSMSTGLAIVVIVTIASCVGVCVAALGILVIRSVLWRRHFCTRRFRSVSFATTRDDGCLATGGDCGGDVIMKSFHGGGDGYPPPCVVVDVDARRSASSSQRRLWTYDRRPETPPPYCDCYLGICSTDGVPAAATVTGSYEGDASPPQPKGTVVVASSAAVPVSSLSRKLLVQNGIETATATADPSPPDPRKTFRQAFCRYEGDDNSLDPVQKGIAFRYSVRLNPRPGNPPPIDGSGDAGGTPVSLVPSENA